MYENIKGVVSCAVGMRYQFKMGVGLHQGALTPLVMDRLTDEVRQESPWKIMFASDSREQVEGSLERWRHELERRTMKVTEVRQKVWRQSQRKGWEGSNTCRGGTEDVEYGAARQEEKREELQRVVWGWCQVYGEMEADAVVTSTRRSQKINNISTH